MGERHIGWRRWACASFGQERTIELAIGSTTKVRPNSTDGAMLLRRLEAAELAERIDHAQIWFLEGSPELEREGAIAQLLVAAAARTAR